MYSQVPNNRGGWEITEKFNKRGGQKKRRGWEFSEKFNLTKQGHTIRQDARVVEYDFWRKISCQNARAQA